MAFQTPITIKSALHKVDFNQLLLPAIQREFEWEWWKIELLFDSLMREYPIGSMLFWRVEGENKTKHRFYTILKGYRERYKTHCDEIDTKGLSSFEAVLDGQQRLTALYIGLKGSYAYKTKYHSFKDDQNSLPTRKLYLNIDAPCSQNELDDEIPEDGRYYDFQFLTEQDLEQSITNWFPVSKIIELEENYDLNEYLKQNKWDGDEFKSKTLSRLQSVIHTKLLINYYLETSQDYEKALNIFIRINSGGKPLSYSDLILSTIISVWTKVDARTEILNIVDFIWDEYGFGIDKDIILRSYLMLYCEDIKFRVTNFNIENAKEFEEHWNSIRNCIVEAFNLVNEFAHTDKTLSAKNAVLPIVYYLYHSNKYKDFSSKTAHKEDREIIKKWLHTVLLKGIFGGQGDTILKIIRDVIRVELDNGINHFPAKEIAAKLAKTKNKSITVDDDFLERLMFTRKDGRYAFSILALLYPHLDFKNNDFNLDHIHPIDSFKKRNIKKSKVEITDDNDWYYTSYQSFDGIVNLQMLDSNDNKSKSNKSLVDWVKAENPNLEKSYIPKDLLEFSQFKEFVDFRWDLIKEQLRKAMTF